MKYKTIFYRVTQTLKFTIKHSLNSLNDTFLKPNKYEIKTRITVFCWISFFGGCIPHIWSLNILQICSKKGHRSLLIPNKALKHLNFAKIIAFPGTFSHTNNALQLVICLCFGFHLTLLSTRALNFVFIFARARHTKFSA